MLSLTKLRKKKKRWGGDIGKAVQGKRGLEPPGIFPSEKNIRGPGRNCGPLGKKEKPTYLVLGLKPWYIFPLCGNSKSVL